MNQQPGRGVPRRTAAKGAAWVVPVIAFAEAAPPASASTRAAPEQSRSDVTPTRGDDANGTATVTEPVRGQNVPSSDRITQ